LEVHVIDSVFYFIFKKVPSLTSFGGGTACVDV